MIVDTSALIAVLLIEPEAEAFARKLKQASAPKLSTASYVEAAIKLAAEHWPDPVAALDEIMASFEIVLVPFDAAQARVAVAARLKYGKGRHPAGLNYGDCLVYALTKITGEPLLYKGDDFARTDVAAAL